MCFILYDECWNIKTEPVFQHWVWRVSVSLDQQYVGSKETGWNRFKLCMMGCRLRGCKPPFKPGFVQFPILLKCFFSSPSKDLSTCTAYNCTRWSLDIRAATGLCPGILAVLQNDAAKHIFYWGNPCCTLIWLNQLFVGAICSEPSSIYCWCLDTVWCE